MRSLALAHAYRSALDDFPGQGGAPAQPSVSIIVPVYNEISSLDRLVADIVTQDYPAICEVWFVDGQSCDGTVEALNGARTLDSRVHVISNPKRLPAAGINLAIEQATGDIVVRFDAHARYAKDVITQSVRALLHTGAGGVGAIAQPAEADTLVGRAIVAAHNSRFGVGVAKFRKAGAEGWTDTVWNGCYWKYIVERVGPLREDLPRAEDNDFNARVRALGYGIYLSPAICATYQPRRSFGELWKQYFGNGLGVARALFEAPGSIGLRHLAPVGLVLALAASFAAAWMRPPISAGALVVPSLYATVLLLATVMAGRQRFGTHLFLAPAALAVLHVSYGCGTLLGLAGAVFRHQARPVAGQPIEIAPASAGFRSPSGQGER
jgi:cellulose synthase/poly-beta-1,6-N-acetylglucosamine synthase-like glycosyltransferase